MGSSAQSGALVFMISHALAQTVPAGPAAAVCLCRWHAVPIFSNPLAQAILKLTSPLVVPVRRMLPPLSDASILRPSLWSHSVHSVPARSWSDRTSIEWPALGYRHKSRSLSAVDLVLLTLRSVCVTAIIHPRATLSWFSSRQPTTRRSAIIDAYHGAMCCDRFGASIPPLGGFDLSPLFALMHSALDAIAWASVH